MIDVIRREVRSEHKKRREGTKRNGIDQNKKLKKKTNAEIEYKIRE